MPKSLDDYYFWLAQGVELQNDVNTREEALAALNKAIEIVPDSATAWAHKAMVLYELGGEEEAVKAYKTAMALDPANPTANLFLANRVYIEDHDLYESLALVEKSLEMNPVSAPAWLHKGFLLDQLNCLEAAVAAFDKAIALGYENSSPFGFKGQLLLNLNRYKEALEAFDEAINRNQRIPNWWIGKGIALAKLKRYEDAISIYDQAVRKFPNLSLDGVLYNKGVSLQALGRYDEALEAYDKSLEIWPNRAEAWNNKRLIFNILGRNDEANQAYERAIGIDPDMVNPAYCSAKEAAERGNEEDVRKYLLAAVKYDREIIDKIKTNPAFRILIKH